jgi:hypothetical protein
MPDSGFYIKIGENWVVGKGVMWGLGEGVVDWDATCVL